MSTAAGPQCLFTLASGRSGTSFLADFFRSHVPACYSTHEPYLTPGNPALFGPAIAWNSEGNDARLLPLLERKCRFISQRRQACYFEGSHAFLKAFNRHAPALLSNPGFVHLLRNPQQVAKSELLREQVIRRFHVPLVDYRRDNGRSCFRWSLTGDEPVFRQFAQHHPGYPLSRFGFYVLQWFEIEYRAMQLLQHHDWQQRVFTIDVATQLQDEKTLAALLDFFDLPQPRRFSLDLHRNRTWFAGPSTLTSAEQDEYRFILQNLPAAYRAVIQQAPYTAVSFASHLEPV